MTAGRTTVGQSQHWGTPPKYVEAVRSFFGGGIDLDPCSNIYSLVKAKKEYSLPLHDGLNESWDYPTIYVNPPYGSDMERRTRIAHWLRKCAEANRIHRSEVLALVPVATNTGHWKEYVFGKATCICFLYDTRLRFLVNGRDEGKGAPMSCAMIYWGENPRQFIHTFSPFGAAVSIEALKSSQSAISSQRRFDNQLSLVYSRMGQH